MATIITREVGATAKGSPLTNAEVDGNFINLNTGKVEKTGDMLTGEYNFKSGAVADFLGSVTLAKPDATSNLELQIYGGDWDTDFATSHPSTGVRLGGNYLAFESNDISMRLNSAQLGSRVIVAGFTERGNALLGVESPPVPDYVVSAGGTNDIVIYTTGTTPSPWVAVTDILTITRKIDPNQATIYFELLVDSIGNKAGEVEIGIGLNGAMPTGTNSVAYQMGPLVKQIYASTTINSALVADQSTARLYARAKSIVANGFEILARNSERPSILKVMVVGGGGSGGIANGIAKGVTYLTDLLALKTTGNFIFDETTNTLVVQSATIPLLMYSAGPTVLSMRASTANGTGFEFISSSSTQRGYLGFGANALPGATTSDLVLKFSNQLIITSTANSEKFRIDYAGNAGLGVVPSPWVGNYRALEVGGGAFWGRTDGLYAYMSSNVYFDGAWRYKVSGRGHAYYMGEDGYTWLNAPSGSGGTAATMTVRMVLTTSGYLGVNTTAPGAYIHSTAGVDLPLRLEHLFGFGNINAAIMIVGDNPGVKGYIGQIPASGGLFLGAGGRYNGSGLWYADSSATTASHMQFAADGIKFYVQGGVVANDTFSPIERLRISLTGNLLVGLSSDMSAVAGKLQIAEHPTSFRGVEVYAVSRNTSTAGRVLETTLISGSSSNPSLPSVAISYAHNSYYELSGELIFKTTSTANALTERMRINHVGNVFIGSPNVIPTDARLNIAAPGAQDVLRWTNGTSNTGYLRINGSAVTIGADTDFIISTGEGSSHVTAEKLRITSGGNVGIAVSSPIGKLSILTGAISPGAAWNSNWVTIGNDPTNGNGSALAFNNDGTNSTIMSLAPNVAWKTLNIWSANTVVYVGGTERFRVSDAGISVAGNIAVSGRPKLFYYYGWSIDSNAMVGNSSGFSYANNSPVTGIVVNFAGVDWSDRHYNLQLNAAYSSNGILYWRTHNGDGDYWNAWQAVPNTNGAGATGDWAISVTGRANQVKHYFNRTDDANYPVLWGTNNDPSNVHSCPNVTINSASGRLAAVSLEARSSGLGALSVVPGLSDRSGYLQFIASNGIRVGYIGYATGTTQDAGGMNYNSGSHQFVGRIYTTAPGYADAIGGVNWAPIETGLTWVPYDSTVRFIPYIHGYSMISGVGYGNHVAFGAYRNGAAGWPATGGAFIGVGYDNDNFCTHNFYFHAGGTISSSAGVLRLQNNLVVNGNGYIASMNGYAPAGDVMQLTPNLHLNSPASYSVILNWANGGSGTQQAVRIGNGAAVDTWYCQHDGTTRQNGTMQAMNVTVMDGFVYRQQHSRGCFVGGYNNIGASEGKTSPIYCIGTSYLPSDTSLGSMYGIGYSTGYGPAGSSGWGLYVASGGGARIFLGSDVGHIWAAGDIVAYTSDRRLKTNIKPIKDALAKIEKINGVEFDWIEGIKESHGFSPLVQHETGVIAQEIQEVIPDAVTTAPFNNEATKIRGIDENFLTVNKEKIIPLLIEAVKELSLQNKDLLRRLELLGG